MPTADYFSGFPTPIVHTAQFQKCLKVFPIDDNKITHNTKISLWWWDMDNRLLAHRLITRGWFVCFSWSAGYSRSVNLCWFIFFFFALALDCVLYIDTNRTDVQCTRPHTRGSGEVMKKSMSLLLISCITISYVIGCYGTLLLILVPSLSVHLTYPYFLCCSSFTLSFCSSSPSPDCQRGFFLVCYTFSCFLPHE